MREFCCMLTPINDSNSEKNLSHLVGAAEHMECASLTLSVQNSLPLVPLVSPTANPGPPAEESRRRRT